MTRFTQIVLFAMISSTFCACSRAPAPASRHYSLTGRVVALNAHDQTATIDAAAIPNYMEAMTMEYPVPSRDDFAKLRVGEDIAATIDVRDDGLYSLSNVQIKAPDRK